MENAYLILIVGLVILFTILALFFVWYQISYEFLKAKIKIIYKRLNEIYKDFKDDDLEIEEQIDKGAPPDYSDDVIDLLNCAVPPKVSDDKKGGK